MKTFLEYIIEQLDEAFVSGGKKYTFGFGKYYCDGKQISKEEYYAAKPSKPENVKKEKKKSEEPAKEVKSQNSKFSIKTFMPEFKKISKKVDNFDYSTYMDLFNSEDEMNIREKILNNFSKKEVQKFNSDRFLQKSFEYITDISFDFANAQSYYWDLDAEIKENPLNIKITQDEYDTINEMLFQTERYQEEVDKIFDYLKKEYPKIYKAMKSYKAE